MADIIEIDQWREWLMSLSRLHLLSHWLRIGRVLHACHGQKVHRCDWLLNLELSFEQTGLEQGNVRHYPLNPLLWLVFMRGCLR